MNRFFAATSFWGKPLATMVVVGSLVMAAAELASAAEPAEKFIAALKERKYYDTALEYLDTIADNPAVPSQYKDRLGYERGMILVEGASSVKDAAVREKWLDDGQKTLSDYLAANTDSPLAVSIRSMLGKVNYHRASTRVEKSKKAQGDAKQKLLNEARTLYADAAKAFVQLTEEIREKLKAYPAQIDEKLDPKRFDERKNLRTEFLQAQLLAAHSEEESAETYAAGQADRNKLLEAAAAKYKKIYEDNRTRGAGLYARSYQARCLQKIGKHKEAIVFFEELLVNTAEGDQFRTVRVSVTTVAIESWLAEKAYQSIVEKALPLVEDARPLEDKTPEFMSMRLSIARALKAFADEKKAKDAKDPQIKKLLTDGRRLVSYAAKFGGPHQDEARKLLAEFTGGDVEAIASGDKAKVKTFQEAQTAGTDAVGRMQDANLLVLAAEKRLPSVTDAAEKADLQKQVEEGKKTAEESKDEALEYLHLAQKYATGDTDVAALNQVRYLLCYLSYANNNFYNAIALGEFIAQRYPDAGGARQCGKIVMASYLKLYAENKSEDKNWEAEKIVEMADYIVKKWPDQPEAEDALNTLIPFMIREKKLKEALAYLGKIPADSPQRGSGEVKTGQALWNSYLEGMREVSQWEAGTPAPPAGTNLVARKAELDQVKKQAKDILTDGVKRMQQSGDMNATIATAALSLAQILVDSGDAGGAVQILEDPKLGPLTLIKTKHPAIADREQFPSDTYRLALRSYISSLGKAKDKLEGQAFTDKAKAIMGDLKNVMGNSPEGQKKLIANYVYLARELQTQMDLAPKETKLSLGVGFEIFLEEIATGASELQILNWVADTYRGMAETLELEKNDPAAAASSKRYFEKAAAGYQKILDIGKTNKTFFPTPAVGTQIRMQLAKTLRSMFKYKEAMDVFEEILKANPVVLPVQIEAARTYQKWGDLGKPENYVKAIQGDRPDATKNNKHTIWGWGEIAKKTGGNPQFVDQLHEARHSLAQCRYSYALADKKMDAAKRDKYLEQSKSDISITIGIYGDGGDKWRPKYDDLLKQIQTALKQPPLGLGGLKVPKPGDVPAGGAPAAAGVVPGAAKGAAPAVPPVAAPAAVKPAAPVVPPGNGKKPGTA